MSTFRFRNVTVMFFVAFLVWSSSFDACIARRGKHWRHNRGGTSVSLYKKSGKTHGSSHHTGRSKSKAPSNKLGKPSSPPQTVEPPAEVPQQGSIFNVLDFGAKGDGKSDDTKAFQAAWAEACKVEASTMLVPEKYSFLVGPVSFSGPYCKANIVFELDGTIIAPTNSNAWGKGPLWWLEFTKLVGISIQGKGTIEGSGSVWWQDSPYYDPVDDEAKLVIPLNNTLEEHPLMPIRNELGGKMPSVKPTVRASLKFDNCIGVVVHGISISSPGDSPNTDGIHLQNSKDVLIHSSTLACGWIRIRAGGVLLKHTSLRGPTSHRDRPITVKPVHFACSDSQPCIDVSLTTIELKPVQERYHMYDPYCWQTFGVLNTPTTPQINCINTGKPPSNRPQTDDDTC